MSQYASKTTVSPEKSRADIEKTLERYGAGEFMYGWRGDQAQIGFEVDGRMIRMVLALPSIDDPEIRETPAGKERTKIQAEKARDQAIKQRWRALLLVVKAKLEAVESGIATMEDEFLAYILLPDGSSVADSVRPSIARAYETGQVQPLLSQLPAPAPEISIEPAEGAK